jgi:hypothetical protein
MISNDAQRGPTWDRLRELVTYDPASGIFTWNIAVGSGRDRRYPGDVAGSRSSDGYWVLHLDGEHLLAHRVAVFYVTQQWPEPEVIVDHRDGDRCNNVWTNFQKTSRSGNQQNRIAARKDNRHGLAGVRRTGNTFWSAIRVDHVDHYLGTFPTALAAHEAYVEAKKRLHPAACRGITVPDRGVFASTKAAGACT